MQEGCSEASQPVCAPLSLTLPVRRTCLPCAPPPRTPRSLHPQNPGWVVAEKEATRRSSAKPTTTLFVVNFDARRVHERDVERHFERYGHLKRVQIKKNYAFVQFDNVDEAERAVQGTNGSDLLGRRITVEFTQNEDPFMRLARPS